MSFGKELSDEFNSLPELVKEIWFEWLRKTTLDGSHDASFFAITYGFNMEGSKSPIEQIFRFAFDVTYFLGGKNKFFEGLCLESQYEMQVGKKKYYGDFMMHHDFADLDKSKSLIIECDGHDFHEKTKAQVAKDNERMMDIKMLGYDVIRFSGSQIYNDPFGCVVKAIEYFKTITVLVEGGGYPFG